MPPESDAESRINSFLDREDGVQHDTSNNGADDQRQGGGQEVATTNQPQQPATRTTADGQPGTQHDAQGGTPQRQQQGSQARPADDGNLVDPATGRVIARAGRERRLYEQQRAVEKATTPLKQQLDRARGELQAFREAAQLPTQLGLGPQDVTTAMQFMAHWKRDPVGAAQNMLTELRAAGYDVSGLGSQVDAGAIRRMVMEAVAPLQQDREAQRLQAEQQAAAQHEVDQLYADMPWTQGQQNELSLILQADESLSLRDAAYQLQIWAIRNGYDIEQPLAPQHQAALARAQGQVPQGNGTQQQPRQQPNNARAPGPMTAADGPLVPRRGASVGHERSSRDIVRESMREAGFAVE